MWIATDKNMHKAAVKPYRAFRLIFTQKEGGILAANIDS